MARRYAAKTRAPFLSLVKSTADQREVMTPRNADSAQSEVLLQVPVSRRADLDGDGVRHVIGFVCRPNAAGALHGLTNAVEIDKAAHRCLRDHRGVDVQYSGKPVEGCWVAESTVHKSATEIAGQSVERGTWTITLGIRNPDIIAMIDKGKLNALSISRSVLSESKRINLKQLEDMLLDRRGTRAALLHHRQRSHMRFLSQLLGGRLPEKQEPEQID